MFQSSERRYRRGSRASLALGLALSLLALSLPASVSAVGPDRIVIREHRGPPRPGAPEEPKSEPIIIDGAALERLAPKVDAMLAALGDRRTFTDYGPDAKFISVEIHRRGKVTRVDSWRPFHRNNPKIALSEKRGLVSVSSAEEKQKVEQANGPVYRAVADLLDALPVP